MAMTIWDGLRLQQAVVPWKKKIQNKLRNVARYFIAECQAIKRRKYLLSYRKLIKAFIFLT